MADTFDIVYCQENQTSLGNLIGLIESRKSILFMGSGPSKNLGYPSWENLLKKLSSLIIDPEILSIIKHKLSNEELLLAAEIVKVNLPQEIFNKLLVDIFKPKEPSFDEIHLKLVKMKFKAFVTTNYDTIIEQALKSIQKPTRNYGLVLHNTERSSVHYFINQLNDESLEERYQLYLHGRYDNPDSIILSYSDYLYKYDGLQISEHEFYKDLVSGKTDILNFEEKTKLKNQSFRTIHFKIIYLLFLTQRLVFVGFGLRDPYLLKIIEELKDDFNPFGPNHFALFSSEEAKDLNLFEYQEKKRFWKDKGIDLVFYEDDPSYKGLGNFIERIPQECFMSPKTLQTKAIPKIYERKVSVSELEYNNTSNSKLLSKTREIINDIKNQ